MTRQVPLRVACVGLGYFSRFHLRAWRRLEHVTLAGVMDTDTEKVAEASREHAVPGFESVGAMLTAVEPHIVDIITPPSAHAAIVRQALLPGRVIVCQKPFCLNLVEAQEVTRDAAAAGTTLAIHENFRFQPWHREIKRRITSGMLGQIYQCRFHLRPGDGCGADAYLDRQPAFQTMPRFLVHETGVHFIDLFRWLFGDVAAVFADLRQLNSTIRGEDAGFILMRHANGVNSLFDGNRLADHAAENRRKTMGEMVVEGGEGTLSLDGYGRLGFRPFGSNVATELPLAYEDIDFGGGCVEALNRHVVEHIVSGGPLENAAEDYLPVIRLVEAAYLSAETGRVVNI